MPIAGRPWCNRRWLVLAPHPDDETLGAGALIAQASHKGLLAGLVYLTDGSGSHPAQDGRSGHLIATRTREAKHALRRLAGNRAAAPVFLDWTDAAPGRAGQACFDKACRRLAVLCERLRVDVLATTAVLEPHCDHEAAAALAYAVRTHVKRRIVVAEYVVWGPMPPARTHRAIITKPIVDGVRRYALAAHRSQLTASLGPGFRLPKDKRRMASRDTLYVRKR
jgi:LmbE family N-acetylglucosaminyl deacetylase